MKGKCFLAFVRHKVNGFILVLCLLLFSSSLYGQTQKITLSSRDISMLDAFIAIEGQSDFSIDYDAQTIDASQRISISSNTISIESLLTEILTPLGYSYEYHGNHIVIKPEQVKRGNEISGNVKDSKGIPIAGANVIIKERIFGTSTDKEGRYSIIANTGEVLEFSFIGFKSKRITVGKSNIINVTLEEDTKLLDEVVVIGYGSVKKSDVTTAVSTVTADNLKNRAAVNFGEAMAGQVPGVLIQQTNGAPGGEGLTIKIRGTGSITQTNDPLYVVDGYPIEGSALRLLNSADIENIQILKDASSTAIYGSRGANGVIIITTKKGSVGKPTVQLNVSVGIQKRENEIKMMNRDEYIQWFIDGRNQAWLDVAISSTDPDKSPHTINDSNSRRSLYPSASSQYMIPDGTGGYKYNFYDPVSIAQLPDNNWQDLLYRNAILQQYELSVSGGSENTHYLFSGSYINQEGIVLGTNYERFNFHTNVSSKICDNFEIGMSLMAHYATGREQANGKDSPVMYALNLPPIYPLHNDDGTYGSMVRNPEILAGDVANPIGIAELVKNHRRRYGYLGTIYAEWGILKNLKYRISIDGSISDNNHKTYSPSNVDLDASKSPRPASATEDRSTDRDWVIENTLNYSLNFLEKNSFNFLIGYSTQEHSIESISGEARTFATDKIETLNAGTMYSLSSTESEYSMISYIGRINYSFDNRYLFTGTIRSDGSSRFGKNKRWGTFPSASIAWRVSQEKFMQNIEPIINDLKIRASYGISGNNRIGNYSSIGLLSTSFYPTGDALQNTVNPSTMSNEDLSWERIRQYNVGFDLGLFNNRIRLESDFYNSRSLDLLLNVPVPTITGYSTQMQNVGKVENKGMEFNLNIRNFVGQFKWSSNFNISFNKNKVLEVGKDGQPIYGSVANASNSFITMVGYPIASFWGYQYEGVFMNQEELEKYPHLKNDKVGDGRYKDINGDGIMDANDKTIIGDNNPDFVYGFSNSFGYKNFSLDLQFTGSHGAEVFSFYKRMVGIYHGDRNALIEQLGRWRSEEDPGDGKHFRPTRTPSGWQRTASSAWVQDASYLRLRNITFSYDFDAKLLSKFKIKGLRLYVTGQNLHTWTDYVGYDPETSTGSGLTQGADYLGYPTASSVIFGANITF